MSGFAANAYQDGFGVRSIVRSLSTAAVALTLPANAIRVVITNVSGNALRVYGTRPNGSTGVTVGAVAAGDAGAGWVSIPVDNATVSRSLVSLPCARASALVAVGAGKATIRYMAYIGSAGPGAQPGQSI